MKSYLNISDDRLHIKKNMNTEYAKKCLIGTVQ